MWLLEDIHKLDQIYQITGVIKNGHNDINNIKVRFNDQKIVQMQRYRRKLKKKENKVGKDFF